MKKHINAIVTKFLFIAPVLGLVGPIFSSMNFKTALITAAIITLGTYLSADLVLLPRMGNIAALLGDALIAAVVYWEVTAVTGWAKFSLIGLLLSALLIMLGEWYFHNYITKTVLRRQQGNSKNIYPSTTVQGIKNQTYKKAKNKRK